MDAQKIISNLEYFDGTFPETSVKEAISQKKEIIPKLLDILKNAVTNIDKLLKDEAYLGHIYAMFLLALFREKTASSLIIGFFTLPEEIVWELTGEIVSDDLGRLLASVSGGDTSDIKELIENDGIDPMVRSAGIDSLLVLYVSGEIQREEIIIYFKDLFEKKLEKQQSFVWNHLVVSSINLYPQELFEQITEAYRKELVDDEFVPLNQVTDALDAGKESVLKWLRQNPDYSLIEDAIADLIKWIIPEEDDE